MCCHTGRKVAEETFSLTQSHYTDTRPTSPHTDPVTPGGIATKAPMLSHWYCWTEESGVHFLYLRISRQMSFRKTTKAIFFSSSASSASSSAFPVISLEGSFFLFCVQRFQLYLSVFFFFFWFILFLLLLSSQLYLWSLLLLLCLVFFFFCVPSYISGVHHF